MVQFTANLFIGDICSCRGSSALTWALTDAFSSTLPDQLIQQRSQKAMNCVLPERALQESIPRLDNQLECAISRAAQKRSH